LDIGKPVKRIITVFVAPLAIACLVGAFDVYFLMPKVFQKLDAINFSDLSVYKSSTGKYKIQLSKTWTVYDNLSGDHSDPYTITIISGNAYNFYIGVDKK
jgi:hypothetical protein